jgi:hypothetical protein
MQVFCPKCAQTLRGDAINVVTDVALCGKCNEVFPLSSLMQAQESGPVDLSNPPRGAWYQGDINGFIVQATTRHPIAFFLVPFMCVWSGFSLGGIYGTQIMQGNFNLGKSLFGIPFLLGTLIFGAVALMAVCGKVVVRVLDSEGVVFTGVGPFGWRRPFNWDDVTMVRVERSFTRNNSSQAMTIVLDGPRKLRFGSGLTENRRDFIANVLRHELMNRSDPHRRAG